MSTLWRLAGSAAYAVLGLVLLAIVLLVALLLLGWRGLSY
jgi:hypothetical protein